MCSRSHSGISLVLWFAAFHSILVGLGLLVIPPSQMHLFGLQAGGERFFQAQGGVFHFVMAIIYFWAAVRQLQVRDLIILVIVIKSAAALFLVTYYLFVQAVWVVAVSAVVDALMAGLIYRVLMDAQRQSLARLGHIR
jgi:hypothetical protein